jgi:glycine/D-amino acid oxidase-like deaminating enzyme/nitrite reductase/ring-hydroxylating ferredoxin subunit
MSTKTVTGQNVSIWSDIEMPAFAAIGRDTKTDVCVIGGGIAGLSTAYLLCKAGKTVALVDDGPLAGGMTQLTTGHLVNAIDNRIFEIERLHGERGVRLAVESHTEAIDRIEAIVREDDIDCDFERIDGYLFLPRDQSQDVLDRELDAAHRAGLNGVKKVRRAPIRSFDSGPCLMFPRQAQFHPLKYLAALAKTIESCGGKIFANTHASKIEAGPPATLRANENTITADAIVVATNSPINDLVAIHTKQAPYMTYTIGARVPKGIVTKALYWDTADPYHYIRLHDIRDDNGHGEQVVIIGGEDHKTGQAEDTVERFDRLEDWARERIPELGNVEYAWSGQVMETIDGLAFIGRNPMDADHIYVVTGDSGMGLTHGTIAGILLTDLICGLENPWTMLYDPARKTLSATPAFAKEALNMAAQYVEWITQGEVKSIDDIPWNSGAIMRNGLNKLAVYRDESGRVHQFSARCPHLACIVHWNAAEKTWDCPCHGSRFSCFGDVINGPANKGLTPAD